MNTADIRSALKRHEGCVLHAYEDHRGYLTIGYGRLVDERRGGGISPAEADQLLTHDIARVIDQLGERAPLVDRLPEPVQHALINMAFQLGVDGLLAFTRMWKALNHSDFPGAADEALDSRWADQTPDRAHEVAEWIRKA